MTTSNALLILQPRRITDALKSLAALPIDKCWFTGFREFELPGLINEFIASTRYANYLVVADDVLATPDALAAVEAALAESCAATGWCNIDQKQPWANVTKSRLHPRGYHRSELWTIDELERVTSPQFDTAFGGWALTGFARELWLQFPFRTNPRNGKQSDFESSWRLQEAGIPIVGVTAGRVLHLRGDPRAAVQFLFASRRRPAVRYDEWQGAA